MCSVSVKPLTIPHHTKDEILDTEKNQIYVTPKNTIVINVKLAKPECDTVGGPMTLQHVKKKQNEVLTLNNYLC